MSASTRAIIEWPPSTPSMPWAEFWLYFLNQKLQQGLEPFKVPELYFFYPSPQEANYFVNIDGGAELKFDAAARQVSQLEPAINRYRPDWEPKDLAKAKEQMRGEQPRKDGHMVKLSVMQQASISI